jgi:hypothetical protein
VTRATRSLIAGDAIGMMRQRVDLRRAMFAGEKTAQNAPLLSIAALAAALSDGASPSRVCTHYAMSFAAIKQFPGRLKAVLGRENTRSVHAVLASMAIAITVRPNDRLVVVKLAQMFLGEPAMDDDAGVAVAL